MLLSGFSLLFFLGALEIVAYLWERGEANGPYAWELVASRRIELVVRTDPEPGYTLLAPGTQGKWGGITLTANQMGLRGPETTFEKPAGTVRILNLGDSIAMGWAVSYEDTYGHQLEGLLAGADDSGAKYEVINAGVPGWNPKNELAYLLDEGFRYEPDLIVLDMTLVNDIYGRTALARLREPGLIDWLQTNTYFYPFLTIQMKWVEARSQGEDRIDIIDPPTRASSYFPVARTGEQWDELWEVIFEIDRAAELQGIPLILVMFPLEFQVVDHDFPTTPQDVLRDRAEQANIPVIDLLPVFRQACVEKPDGPCELEDRYLFADVWMHPSAIGHRLTAERLFPPVFCSLWEGCERSKE
jgi:hypothetical protein